MTENRGLKSTQGHGVRPTKQARDRTGSTLKKLLPNLWVALPEEQATRQAADLANIPLREAERIVVALAGRSEESPLVTRLAALQRFWNEYHQLTSDESIHPLRIEWLFPENHAAMQAPQDAKHYPRLHKPPPLDSLDLLSSELRQEIDRLWATRSWPPRAASATFEESPYMAMLDAFGPAIRQWQWWLQRRPSRLGGFLRSRPVGMADAKQQVIRNAQRLPAMVRWDRVHHREVVATARSEWAELWLRPYLIDRCVNDCLWAARGWHVLNPGRKMLDTGRARTPPLVWNVAHRWFGGDAEFFLRVMGVTGSLPHASSRVVGLDRKRFVTTVRGRLEPHRREDEKSDRALEILANLSLFYLQIWDVSGRPPTKKQFGDNKWYWAFDGLKSRGRGWPAYEGAIREAMHVCRVTFLPYEAAI